MSNPILLTTQLNANFLNQYLGNDANKQLSYSGVDGAPNFSLNQIFFSSANTNNPPQPASNKFEISSLIGKTFGIYRDTNRATLYGSAYSIEDDLLLNENDLVPLVPVFLGYFGFGNSGILSPFNKGFPLLITIESDDWSSISVALKTGNGFNYEAVPLSGSTHTFVSTTGDAIRILGGLRLAREIVVNLTVAPCLRGSGVGGTGFHKIQITLSSGGDPPSDPELLLLPERLVVPRTSAQNARITANIAPSDIAKVTAVLSPELQLLAYNPNVFSAQFEFGNILNSSNWNSSGVAFTVRYTRPDGSPEDLIPGAASIIGTVTFSASGYQSKVLTIEIWSYIPQDPPPPIIDPPPIDIPREGGELIDDGGLSGGVGDNIL